MYLRYYNLTYRLCHPTFFHPALPASLIPVLRLSAPQLISPSGESSHPRPAHTGQLETVDPHRVTGGLLALLHPGVSHYR
jgi:hypothetical protein